MPDPLLAAVERLSASVDALPEAVREPWIVEGPLTNAVVRTEGGSYVVSTGDEYSIAAHIATFDPPTVRLLADLLEALEWLPWSYGTATDEQYANDIRTARDALASHLTEGSGTP